MAGQQLLEDFDSKCTEWANLSYESEVWRRDWACKEVIKHVRMSLAGRRGGWWSRGSTGTPVDWESLKDETTRAAHDRIIERTAQPKLVQIVARRLVDDATFDLRSELNGLATMICD